MWWNHTPQRVVEIVIDNDGDPIPREAVQGIGSQLFEEQTLSWSRKNIGQRVRVTARLPLTAEDLTVAVD